MSFFFSQSYYTLLSLQLLNIQSYPLGQFSNEPVHHEDGRCCWKDVRNPMFPIIPPWRKWCCSIPTSDPYNLFARIWFGENIHLKLPCGWPLLVHLKVLERTTCSIIFFEQGWQDVIHVGGLERGDHIIIFFKAHLKFDTYVFDGTRGVKKETRFGAKNTNNQMQLQRRKQYHLWPLIDLMFNKQEHEVAMLIRSTIGPLGPKRWWKIVLVHVLCFQLLSNIWLLTIYILLQGTHHF